MLGRHNGHGGQLGGDRGHGDPQRLSDGGLPRCSSTPITRTAWPRVVLSGGGVQINSFQQFISFNNTSRAGAYGSRLQKLSVVLWGGEEAAEAGGGPGEEEGLGLRKMAEEEAIELFIAGA